MHYKIDTHQNFDIVTPVFSVIDAKMMDELNDLADDCSENGRSILLDLASIESVGNEHIQLLETLHHEMYQHNLSFVICHVNNAIKRSIAEHELEHVLNVTPTRIEGIDLISMEGLERELLGDADNA
jgi:anti-anti-sigma regulatory factor